MVFTLLVFLAALALEVIGTWVSVIGLSSMFAASPVVIILAICLDFAKVVTVSYTYSYWDSIKFLRRTYYLFASVVLMVITSAGAFGYLSGEFQKAVSDTNQQGVMLTALTEEQAKYQKRKEEIDKQITQLPESNVRGRTQLLRQFGPEIKRINDRLVQIDKELPALKVDSIKKNVEVGPIIYIAEAFDTTPEKAVKWVILTIIFVFDPLAISLLLAGNSLIEINRKKKLEAVKPSETIEEEPTTIVYEHEVELPKASDVPDTIVNLDEDDQPAKESKSNLKVVQDGYGGWELESKEDTPAEESKIPSYVTIVPDGNGGFEPEFFNTQKSDAAEELPKIDIVKDVPAVKQEDNLPEINFVEPTTVIKEDEQDREVITFETLMRPPVKNPPIHSSLHDIDGKHGDIVNDDEPDHRRLKPLFSEYTAEHPKD